jgi:hypothetical protein
MGILTEEIKDFAGKEKLGFIAAKTADGLLEFY